MKVYCGECFYYCVESDDYHTHCGCKKIKHEWDEAYGRLSINGYAEQINAKNDCKKFRQITRKEQRRKNLGISLARLLTALLWLTLCVAIYIAMIAELSGERDFSTVAIIGACVFMTIPLGLLTAMVYAAFFVD